MSETKMETKEFARRAIVRCRKEGFKGLHTVYSGFNAAWREYYGKENDPIVGVNKLVMEGYLMGNPSKGGFTIYLPEDATSKPIQVALNKILAD